MNKKEALDLLQEINQQHKPSIYRGGYCACGCKAGQCVYFLMLELFNVVLAEEVSKTPPERTNIRQITEYGYMYGADPCWSPTSKIGAGWNYSDAVFQRREAQLWGDPDLVGPVIERTVDCYEVVPGDYRIVGSST